VANGDLRDNVDGTSLHGFVLYFDEFMLEIGVLQTEKPDAAEGVA